MRLKVPVNQHNSIHSRSSVYFYLATMNAAAHTLSTVLSQYRGGETVLERKREMATAVVKFRFTYEAKQPRQEEDFQCGVSYEKCAHCGKMFPTDEMHLEKHQSFCEPCAAIVNADPACNKCGIDLPCKEHIVDGESVGTISAVANCPECGAVVV